LKNLSLTYCTNVHPLGNFDSWKQIIRTFGGLIRSEMAWEELPMGLWFPAALVEELEKDWSGSVFQIKNLLEQNRLSAFTCNAFPFGNFHEKVVKTKVYQPDWTTPERLNYTLACTRLLAALLPAGEQGSISTLPLGWRIGWHAEQTQIAARNLLAFVQGARDLADKEGKIIQLGLEPEPGCVLETTDQVLAFWQDMLRPEAKLAGISDDTLNTFLGLCYDTCHQAVQFETPSEVLQRLKGNGIPIAKMQLSSALEFKADPSRQSESLRLQFVEERFLHQTRIATPTGILHFDDLPQALNAATGEQQDLWSYPWRVHFHVPIDAADMLDSTWVGTTRGDMLSAYHYAVKNNLCQHFEIETYTWSVLPEAHRPKDDAELARSLARELLFVSTNLVEPALINGIALGENKHV
jgi:hypothetical protein